MEEVRLTRFRSLMAQKELLTPLLSLPVLNESVYEYTMENVDGRDFFRLQEKRVDSSTKDEGIAINVCFSRFFFILVMSHFVDRESIAVRFIFSVSR